MRRTTVMSVKTYQPTQKKKYNDKIIKELTKEFENINVMDGVRVDLENGWVLIRSSNTSPIIRVTTEANNERLLGKLTTQFMDKTEEIIEKLKGETK